MSASPITNVFVVVLENRSFDHMLGFSGITGTDAVTGQPTSIAGLNGTETNSCTIGGTTYTVEVSQPAPLTLPVDPGHEFPDVLTQLCGSGVPYPSCGAYPTINNSGFVCDWLSSPSSGEGNAPPSDVGEIMQCNSTYQLPVLNALANEFAVCDNWFSSVPGPTWPNRFFIHGASSAGWVASPSAFQIGEWIIGFPSGFEYPNGSIFGALNGSYRLYFDSVPSLPGTPLGNLPIVAALKGIDLSDVNAFSTFASDLQNPYPYMYTHLEPSYGAVAAGTYADGSSQHPLDSVVAGEAFLKAVYEALRASPIWDSSLLIVTWDEHGGLYDHVAPPAAIAPGDTTCAVTLPSNPWGFNFEQYGVRVPAVVISPLIPQNLIDHRLYDHSSIPATLESIFGLNPLTARDATANNVTPLVSLTSARSTPTTLPSPWTPPAGAWAAAARSRAVRAARAITEPADSDSLPGFLYIAMKEDVRISGPGSEVRVRDRVARIANRADAIEYFLEVAARCREVEG